MTAAPPARYGDALTDREREIIGHVAEGRSNAAIGRQLYISEDTVKSYLRRAFRKLGANDRTHAVTLARRADALPDVLPDVGPPPVSRGALEDVIRRWEGRVPAAMLGELRDVAAPAVTT